MLKSSTLLAIVPALVALCGTAEAACVYPQAPQSLPNGNTATEADMKAANGQIKDYVKSVQETYLQCLDKEKNDAIAALDNTDPEYPQKKAALEAIQAKKNNAAVDELQALATRWNAEIKAFKEKSSK
jgi:hypothetical protein